MCFCLLLCPAGIQWLQQICDNFRTMNWNMSDITLSVNPYSKQSNLVCANLKCFLYAYIANFWNNVLNWLTLSAKTSLVFTNCIIKIHYKQYLKDSKLICSSYYFFFKLICSNLDILPSLIKISHKYPVQIILTML